MLPLVTRTAKSLSSWLAPAFAGSDPAGLTPSLHGGLELRPDIDSIEALSTEREALWTRIDKATFLTQNEKRAAVGYGPVDGGDALAQKASFNPGQLRIPAGQPGGGQWTTESGESVVPVADRPGDRRGGRRGGGLPQAVWNFTVRQFVSRYCRASINRELPGQFQDLTIGELLDIARGGDRAARTCVKLLQRNEYRKQ